MKSAAMTFTTMALALSLAMPLAACGGQASQSGSEDAATEQASTEAAGAVDVSSWKTLGDALALRTEDGFESSSWDEEHYVIMFEAGDQVFRVVAKMDADTYAKTVDLDASQDDYQQRFADAIGGLEIESAEDLTSEKLTQDQMDAYVGKTGQDLLDEGWTFSTYFMYGGEETGATMDKGYLAYNVTFDVTVPEDQTEDEGAALKDATITAVEFFGGADSAVDPTNL